jgi:hypothetical protein
MRRVQPAGRIESHELTPEDARKGALRAAEVRRQKREQAAAKMEAALAADAEKIAAALLEEVLQNPRGHANNRVPAVREAFMRLAGRPPTVISHEQDPDRPIRIVVESISSRRREALADVEADVEADDAEVEELGDKEDVA